MANMEIHPKLKPFHKLGNCVCPSQEPVCWNWIACGPGYTCFHRRHEYIATIPIEPCEYCGFWTGHGMKDWEIENAATMLEIMAYSRTGKELK